MNLDVSTHHLNPTTPRPRRRQHRDCLRNTLTIVVFCILSIKIAAAVPHYFSRVEMILTIRTGVAFGASPYRSYPSSVRVSRRERRIMLENNYAVGKFPRSVPSSVSPSGFVHERQLGPIWDAIKGFFEKEPDRPSPVKSPHFDKTPTGRPWRFPTRAPKKLLTKIPTKSLITAEPTTSPTKNPTKRPTEPPTNYPTLKPSSIPSNLPTQEPSPSPTDVPSFSPSSVPTDLPSATPSVLPSTIPSKSPSHRPTQSPTASPLDPLFVQKSYKFMNVRMIIYGNLRLPMTEEQKKTWEMVTADRISNQIQNDEQFERYGAKESLVVKIDLINIEYEVEDVPLSRRMLQMAPSNKFTFNVFVTYHALHTATSSNDILTYKACLSIVLDTFDSRFDVDVYLQSLRDACNSSKYNCHNDDEEGVSSKFVDSKSVKIAKDEKNTARSTPLEDNRSSYIIVASIGCVGIILISFYVSYTRQGATNESDQDEIRSEDVYSYDKEKWMDGLTIRDMDQVGEGVVVSLKRRLSWKQHRSSVDPCFTVQDDEPERYSSKDTSMCDGTITSHDMRSSIPEKIACFSLKGQDFDSDRSLDGSDDYDVTTSPSITKTIFDLQARPRKLGIIVHSPDPQSGPIVHTIKDSSPLLGKIRMGDRIIAIDDQDTTNMSAYDVEKTIARKNKNKDVRFTIERRDALLPNQQNV